MSIRCISTDIFQGILYDAESVYTWWLKSVCEKILKVQNFCLKTTELLIYCQGYSYKLLAFFISPAEFWAPLTLHIRILIWTL